MTIVKVLLISCGLLLWASMSLAQDDGSGTGTVVETMESGGYVYVRLQEGNRWVASAPINVSVGDKVKYSSAMMMKNFRSRTLERDFEDIWFAVKLEVVTPISADAHASVTTATSEQLGISKSVAAVAPVSGEIAPLDGGKTIDLIQTEYKQLEGQQVALRARVMKVSENILGKNWITLQDGTGTEPENKLLATSAELVGIGDTVTVTGTIKTDVDLGSGYKYRVVMVEATFSN